MTASAPTMGPATHALLLPSSEGGGNAVLWSVEVNKAKIDLAMDVGSPVEFNR